MICKAGSFFFREGHKPGFVALTGADHAVSQLGDILPVLTERWYIYVEVAQWVHLIALWPGGETLIKPVNKPSIDTEGDPLTPHLIR